MIARNAGEIFSFGSSGVDGSNSPARIFAMISFESAPETDFRNVTISFRIMPSANTSVFVVVIPS